MSMFITILDVMRTVTIARATRTSCCSTSLCAATSRANHFSVRVKCSRLFSSTSAFSNLKGDRPPTVELNNELLEKSIGIESEPPEAEAPLLTYKDCTLKEVLDKKRRGKTSEAISYDKTVFEAIREMTEKRVGAIIVNDDKGNIAGIFTERDYLNNIAVKGRNSRETKVQDAMTQPVITAPSYAKIGPVLQLMTEKRFRHIPVVDNDSKVIGLVSIGDLVKEITEEYKTTISNLKTFIQRTY